MYDFIRVFIKKLIVPLLDFLVRILPKSLRVFLFASIADSLRLTNVRFDTPMKLNAGAKSEGSSLNLGLFPGDRSVVPSILISGQWELSEPEFVASRIDRDGEYTLFDVGANFGLFSLQLVELLRSDGKGNPIKEIYLFEPDPKIAPVLRQNIEQLKTRNVDARVVEKALGKSAGKAIFYLDNANKANNSLAKGAMNRAVGGVTQIEVDVIGATDLLEMMPKDPATRIVYKSDLQGIDPDIVSAIPEAFWDRVDVLVIELWPQVLKDYDFSTESFQRVLAKFGTILIEDRGVTKPISIAEIATLIANSEDHRYFNLLCDRPAHGR